MTANFSSILAYKRKPATVNAVKCCQILFSVRESPSDNGIWRWKYFLIFYFFFNFGAFFTTVWISQCNYVEYNGWRWSRTVIQSVVFLLLGEPDWFHYDRFLSGLISKWQPGHIKMAVGLVDYSCRCNPAEALWKGVKKVDVILHLFVAFICLLKLAMVR